MTMRDEDDVGWPDSPRNICSKGSTNNSRRIAANVTTTDITNRATRRGPNYHHKSGISVASSSCTDHIPFGVRPGETKMRLALAEIERDELEFALLSFHWNIHNSVSE
jgi:hypothetical protein